MEITVYFSPTCPWSKQLMTWLRRKRIKFEEKDVVESQHGTFRDELLEKSGQLATPVIDIDGKIIVGFQKEEIEKILNSQ